MPVTKNILLKDSYKDSIQLMRVSEEAKKLEGVLDVAVVMGTPTNKDLLERVGLLTEDGRRSSNDDIIIAIRVDSASRVSRAITGVETTLAKVSTNSQSATSTSEYFSSIEAALIGLPGANFAIISVPGPFVREVATTLLERGLHIQIFSDHVSLADEAYLKKLGAKNGLLVLGPGAGTSILGGKAIAFSNRVNRGRVGIVAAAGTGLQELSVLISGEGHGISQGLGVGGGDVKKEVGGLMSLAALRALEHDPQTEKICFVSKPPSGDVLRRILRYVSMEAKKNYILTFFGENTENLGQKYGITDPRIIFASSLHAAAIKSTKNKSLTQIRSEGALVSSELTAIGKSKLESLASSISTKLSSEQSYIRGLYTGGTLMAESLQILTELLGGGIQSNSPFAPGDRLADSYVSVGHTLIDFGEEEFTSGRPHPMIDPTIRGMRLETELKDAQVACVMLDVILGYGSHSDPAGAVVEAIRNVRASYNSTLRVPILAHVCGTKEDPQNADVQKQKLKEAGAFLLPSNAMMAFLSALIATRGKVDATTKERAFEDFLCIGN